MYCCEMVWKDLRCRDVVCKGDTVLKQVLIDRAKEIEQIILSDEEREKAIWEAKVRKWFEERSREYWQELEKQKSNTK